MKKLFYLFLLLPFSLFISCSDDKDFSPVDMTITLGGVTQYDNNFYAVKGDNVSIEDLQVKSVDGKNTAVANVTFYLDGLLLPPSFPGSETMVTFSTENIPAGTYSINVAGNLLQVDSSIMNFAVNYTLTVVDSPEDLPAGAPDLGSYSQTLRINQSK